MWRLGVLLVFTVVFRCSSSTDFVYASDKLQRLKRSPHYHCPPYFYDAQPRHFPGPPPPPYWPPPPPPGNFFQERRDFQNELQPQNLPNFNQNSPNPNLNQNFPYQNTNENNPNENFNKNSRSQKYSQEETQANPKNGQEETYPENKPCDKCGKGQDTAISNAESVSGSAIAVSISGKGST
ncbi:hypothetical protein evm_007534 [Chilo suppressalis]|nr:hypothetical protein evm_007534 [Chilo suppressalis]